VRPVRPGRVRLVGEQHRRGCPWPAGAQPRHPQASQQHGQGRRVAGLTGRADQHQRPAPAVNQRVRLGGQPAARASDAMIVGFVPSELRLLVVRWRPLCARSASKPTSQQWRRADAPGRWSSPPTPASPGCRRRRPAPEDGSAAGPRCRPGRTGGAASTPSARDRTPPAGHARAPRSDTDGRSPPAPDGGPGTVGPVARPRTGATARSGTNQHHSAPQPVTCPQHRPERRLTLGDTP
jgi:hypothetical protein